MILSIIAIISGFIILYSLWFVIATTSIWFVKIWNANEVLRSTLVSGRYPITAYPPILRTFFTFVLPVAFLTSIPVETILGRSSGLYIFLSVVLASLFLLASQKFWEFALKYYTSASS